MKSVSQFRPELIDIVRHASGFTRRKKVMAHLNYSEMQLRRFATDSKVTRRRLLARGIQVGAGFSLAAALLGRSASTIVAQDDVTLREIGLSLTEDPRILSRFREDTGITMEGNSQILGNQITFWLQNYQDYDVNQVNFSQNAPLLAQAAIQSFPTADIPAWNEQVLELFRVPGVPGYSERSGWPLTGTYTSEAVLAETYDTFIGTPTWFGFDAFGYLEGQAQGDVSSYGAIFDPANRGHATLLNEPITSVMKVATYLQGTGQAEFDGPLNNLTRDDLQICFDFLNEKKQDGQFRLFWSDFGQLVDLLVAGEVWVGDFWASACAAARASGAPAVFVNDPAEGSNGWIQGATISAATEQYPEVAIFINWYLDSGWPGSILGVQGYYSPRPDRVQPILEEQSTTVEGISDWDYWYMGAVPEERPALSERLNHVADWQAYPDEYEEYSRLWTAFTAA
jgi:putative spermidine/putrescine transport system substrate-binding protein